MTLPTGGTLPNANCKKRFRLWERFERVDVITGYA
jgi:hypothetical protein